jgi:hypothetical protein
VRPLATRFASANASAEKKIVVERAEAEYLESRFDVKKLTQMWKT